MPSRVQARIYTDTVVLGASEQCVVGAIHVQRAYAVTMCMSYVANEMSDTSFDCRVGMCKAVHGPGYVTTPCA